MMALLPLLAAQAIVAAPPVADWATLPPFPLPRSATIIDGSTFVRGEIDAGRCQPPAVPPADGARLVAPVAILVGTSGMVRQIVPRAIGCSTVEQYTVGYLLSLTRTGSGYTPPSTPGWYRLVVGYQW